MSALRRVVIVGRPNVGKSALFNRLAGSRRAIVHDQAGMTRDSLELEVKTGNGKPYLLVDTGGLDLDADAGFAALTSERAMSAIGDADLLLLVIDGAVGVLPEDARIAARLRVLGKPVVVVWNKADVKTAVEGESEGHTLGFPDVVTVSALHGIGAGEIDDIIERFLPEELDPETRTQPLSLAILGRPNVGKSSLVNAMLGTERVMVSDVAGTTRDAIDVRLTKGGREYLLVDTAGMRRKGKAHDAPEVLSMVSGRKALERARIAVLVFDASEGVTAQDATIAGMAVDAGRGIVLVANKWDLIEKDRDAVQNLREDVKRRFVFARRAAFVPSSAKNGRGVAKILVEADAVAKRFTTKFTTGELNRVVEKAAQVQCPSGRSGKPLKIRYVVQVASNPPLIRLFCDRAEPLHFSFERYLQNRIRDKWDLDGVPMKIIVKAST
jgi:GTP-binding protein